jgi:hypothetical protein
MSTRETYIAKMKLQLDEFNAAIDELEIKAGKATGIARKKYRAEMVMVHRQAQLFLGKLDELKSSSEDAWVDLAAGVDKTREAFVHSFHNLQSQL